MTHGDGSITVNDDARPVLVTLSGDIDIKTITDAARQRLSLIDTDGEIIVDLQQVGFMDSIGVSLLLEMRHCASAGVRLRQAPASLLKLLDVTGVASLFTIEAQPTNTDR